MTYLITQGDVGNVAWFAVCWLALIAVVGSILLARWLRREHEDAAETERVMGTLGFDHTHAHEQDAL